VCPQPLRRLGHGRLAFLVLHRSGEFLGLDPRLLEELLALPSIRRSMFFPKPGALVQATTNCFTWGGVAVLAHEQEAVVEADYSRVRAMELAGLFLIKES
jgi:hypothetical protein